MELDPIVNGCEFPKKDAPLAVVLNTRKFAPPAGRLVTCMVNVCTPWLGAPSAMVVAVRTNGHAVGPIAKSPEAEIKVVAVVDGVEALVQ